MKYSEVKCPKCKSSSFDEVDSTQTDLEGGADVEYECKDCGCHWLQGMWYEFTDEQEIIED